MRLRSATLALLAGCILGCGAAEDGEGAGELAEGPEAFDEAGELLADANGKADEFGVDLPANHPLPEGAGLDAPLQALFAPDDPVTTLEVSLIDRVRQARDAGELGTTRIRYGVYNLRNARIVEALAKAAEAGVEVRIVIEADQMDPARTWNNADEVLAERGFKVFPDHRDAQGEDLGSASLVGIKQPGLMHIKTRLYEAGEFTAALTGSMNPGDHAAANEETLHLVRDKRLIERYEQAWEAIAGGGRRIDNRWDDDEAVNVLFTPGGDGPRAGERMLRWLAEEDEQILLMVFSLRDFQAPGGRGGLVDVLEDRAAAGVPVVVITDQKQSDGIDAEGARRWFDDRTDDRLRSAGVKVFEVINRASPYTAMHHKVAVLGRSRLRVITDAANWTKAALGTATKVAKNVESVLFIDSTEADGGVTGRRYLAQWLRVLRRYVDAGEAEALIDGLASASEWPAQPVRFEARRTETVLGEAAVVLGDLDGLGAWGDGGSGVVLTTGPDSYPTWRSKNAAPLPLGATFEWKLAIRGADGAGDIARWEAGDNRVSLAAPTPLDADGELDLGATWR